MWDQAQAEQVRGQAEQVRGQAEQVRGQAEQVRGQARGLCVCAVSCMWRAQCVHVACVPCVRSAWTKTHVAVGAFVVIPSRRRALSADDVFLQFVAVPDTWLGAAANPTE